MCRRTVKLYGGNAAVYAALATKQQQHPLFDYRVDISRKISEASFFFQPLVE